MRIKRDDEIVCTKPLTGSVHTLITLVLAITIMPKNIIKFVDEDNVVDV